MKTSAHIASIPDREVSLRMVIDALIPQVDEIYVALNGYPDVPDWIYRREKVTAICMDNSLGDAAKFAFFNLVDGLILILDDDLVVCDFYVETMKAKVAEYKCPISLHGKVYGKRPIESFRRSFTENYRCLNTVVGDHRVDIIGTGCMAFEKGMVDLSLKDFPVPNMADIWYSKLAHGQGVPLMVAGHSPVLLRYITPKTTIWRTHTDDTYYTEVLNSFLK